MSNRVVDSNKTVVNGVTFMFSDSEVLSYLRLRFARSKGISSANVCKDDLEHYYMVQGLSFNGVSFDDYLFGLEKFVVGRYVE